MPGQQHHLSRTYRRLLRVYPPGARRDELLDTLLDAAPAGRRRPTVREAVNLLRHGLRARLGRPGGVAVVVLAVLASLAGGHLAAAGTARLAWTAVPDLPTGAAAAEISGTVFPGLTVWGGGEAPDFQPSGDGESVEHGSALSWVKHTPATRDVPAYAQGAADRLAAAGWTLRSDVAAHPDPGSELTAEEERNVRSFWATRGGLVLEYHASFWPGRPWYDADGAVTYSLYRLQPPWIGPVAVAGGLIGALAVWFAAGWVSRRTERNPGRSALIGVGTVLTALVLAPGALLGAARWALVSGSAEPPVEPTWPALQWLGPLPLTVGALTAGGALLLAALPGRLRAPRTPAWLRRRPASLAGLAVVVVALSVVSVARSDGARWAGAPRCAPTVPPARTDGGDLRRSPVARVFVSPQATADQRNLVEAGISRVTGTRGMTFSWEPDDGRFREAYCGDAHLPASAIPRLAYFWTVWMAGPGAFPALEAEVGALAGVVAVQRAPAED